MLVAYGSGFRPVPVRGVCAEYGEMRSEVPSDGRWISPDDVLERRRVVFLGSLARQRLFSGRPAVGETVLIGGLRFTVIGSMDRKLQLSNYFWSDDESMFIPFTAAADLWDTQYASVMLFSTVNLQFEPKAMQQVRAAVAKRQRFSPTDKRAITMYGREEFRGRDRRADHRDGSAAPVHRLPDAGHRRGGRHEHHAGFGG